jgi:hypothetical protein
MDLRTVRGNADAGRYEDADALAADVRLVFDNAMKYNPPKVRPFAPPLFRCSPPLPLQPFKRSALPPRPSGAT